MTVAQQTPAEDQETAACFLSRHPVFNKNKKVVAHDVAARSCLVSQDTDRVDADAFSWMVSDGAQELQHVLEESEKLMIAIPDVMLDAPEVHMLPMDFCQLVISPEQSSRDNLSELLVFFSDYGYELALRFQGSCQAFGELIKHADTVILDLAHLKPLELAKERKFLKGFEVAAMVDNVDTWEAFAGSKALGFDYFQGSFFGRPEIVKGRKLAASSLTRVELMEKLLDENSTFKDMAAIIEKDAMLSYRLLRFVNSPGHGLGRTVTSIEHAVAILGDTSFKHWAMMALVASLDASAKGEELGYLSLQRASFLERLAARATASPLSPKTMFLLGLFSLLDAMLGQPMDQLVANMPMDPRIKAALTGETNSLSPWLKLLSCVDQNRWCDVGAILAGQKVSHSGAARDYLEASRWARICFNAGKQEKK
ncbi:EAL and HDOD domain-containing protein [Fundidesulfovibrio terrae]|uniref:EAL and HDOD domain-containing protein n=1 Tax=Fundidesulfovibrio terrae TaxID=2922866 RepID=UPI001FAEA3DC|nr:HDOD domain-containing protein [Fundidesulfovibrio terrae]